VVCVWSSLLLLLHYVVTISLVCIGLVLWISLHISAELYGLSVLFIAVLISCSLITTNKIDRLVDR